MTVPRVRIPGLPIALAATLSACASVPVDEPPQRSLRLVTAPDEWQAGTASSRYSTNWISSFADPRLEILVSEATSEVAGNFSLLSAVSRVEASRARHREAGADRLPQLSASLSAARARQSFGGVATTANEFGLQAQLQWELDLWGRLSNNVRAALFDYEAAEADLAAARLSLTANVARAWYNAVAARRRQELAQRTAESFAKSLEVIEERYQRGIGSALEVSLARANAATAQSRLEARRSDAANSILALEVLLGRYPHGRLTVRDELPAVPASPGAGLPLQLLERRPDLRAAHMRFLASTSRNIAAQRNMLPGLSIIGSDGLTTTEFRDLFDLDDLVWRIAAQLTAPIFQGGRLKAQREQASAVKEQALWDYAATALQAFQEVESALRAEQYLARQEEAQAIATQESELAEQLANEGYASGLVDITTLLESQRRAFDASSALIDLRNLRLQNRINLHLALGGDADGAATGPGKR